MSRVEGEDCPECGSVNVTDVELGGLEQCDHCPRGARKARSYLDAIAVARSARATYIDAEAASASAMSEARKALAEWHAANVALREARYALESGEAVEVAR